MDFFAHPRPKKSLLPPPPRRKRNAAGAVDEVAFDPEARTNYLTGFHRRKQARIKHAQELAGQRARQEKLDARKQIREDRKNALEAHIQSVNNMLLQAQRAGQASSEDEVGGREGDADGDKWAGLSDDEEIPLPPPPPPEPAIDREDEFVDEDRYTTVTVEAVSVDKQGLHKPGHRPEKGGRRHHHSRREETDDEEDDSGVYGGKKKRKSEAGEGEGEGSNDTEAGRRLGDGERREAAKNDTRQGKNKKKKKRDFRYESKAEREAKGRKGREGRAKQALKRKGG